MRRDSIGSPFCIDFTLVMMHLSVEDALLEQAKYDMVKRWSGKPSFGGKNRMKKRQRKKKDSVDERLAGMAGRARS